MWSVFLNALLLMLGVAFLAWIVSLARRDVSIVDILWPLFFLLAAAVYFYSHTERNATVLLIFFLVGVWALRLSVHLSVRNWGEPEDRRYREIRANNQPNFAFKSLYLIFFFQAVLAWIISAPLLVALTQRVSFHYLDGFAIALFAVGVIVESLADYQLLVFRRTRDDERGVLQQGLWRYSRHPNYFGEFCVCWSFYLFAVPAGGWWTIFAPLMMTYFLLKFSGVGLMEKDIATRRPEYQAYVQRTSVFLPLPPKKHSSPVVKGGES